MKLRKYLKFAKKKQQQGITLLEIMVAMGIGMILLLALVTLMLVANRSSKNRSTAELMDETARQVFSRFETDFRQAGYVDPFTNDLTVTESFNLNEKNRLARYIRQKENLATVDKNQLSLLGKMSKGNVQPIKGCGGILSDDGKECTTVANSAWHSIQIAYQAVSPATANDLVATSKLENENKSDSNAAMGCVNRSVTADKPIVVNKYYFLSTDSKENVKAARNLQCNTQLASLGDEGIDGSTRTAEPIVEGVEQMVFRYLVTPSDGTAADEKIEFDKLVSGRSVEKYVSAEAVEKLDLKWANVVGVEVCLIVAVQPLDGSKDPARVAVQPKIPTCLREEGTDADTAFKGDIDRPSNWYDTREYRRYVRIFSLPGSLYLPSVDI